MAESMKTSSTNPDEKPFISEVNGESFKTLSDAERCGYDLAAQEWLYTQYWMTQYQFYLHCLQTAHHLVSQTVQPVDEKKAGEQSPSGIQTQRNVSTREIIGYEVYCATFLRRFIAEIFDLLLLIFLLTLIIPGFDIRLPEDVILEMDFDQMPLEVLGEIEVVLMTFLRSLGWLHLAKIVSDTLMVSLLGVTPGKWLCGLRVLHCTNYIMSPTNPPFSYKVEPGVRLPLAWSLLRATFKSAMNIFAPLLVFLLFAKNGRTKYDEITRSAVVHVNHLYKPIFNAYVQQ